MTNLATTSHDRQEFLGEHLWRGLSDAQRSCVQLACTLGLSDAEVAQRLLIGSATVRAHILAARKSMGISGGSPRALVTWWFVSGPGSIGSIG